MRTTQLLLALVTSLALAAASGAASPSLGSVTPRGGQRGTDMTLVFSGARLADAQEILWYHPGIQVLKIEPVNDNQFKAQVRIAPDCRLGEHEVRVRAATGVSELRTFFVGALPVVDEKEPNTEFDKPQPIGMNVTVQGVVQSEDVDYYVVEAKKGQRLSVEIEAMRLANTLFDPYIAILDSKRFELAVSDDAPLLKQDSLTSVVVPEDGKYIIQVRDSSYGGNGASAYRLHVGTFPRPQAVIPAGGKLGEEVELRFLGDPTGEIKQKVKLPAEPKDPFTVHAQDANGVSPSGIPFRLSEFRNVIEAEPNDGHAQATPGVLPVAFNGVIDKPGDIDCFRFAAKKGQVFDVHCYARRLGSPLDPVMTVSHLNGGGIVGNDDSGGPDSYFRFTAPEDKEYVVTIQDHLAKGGPTYFYRVEFTPVQPRLSITLPKVALFSQERQTIAVPRGNRFAALLVGSRADFGGELIMEGKNLPAGITLASENMAANLNTVPVVFEAKPDAPLAGTLAELLGRHPDPNVKLKSGFTQTVELVTGGPGQSVYWRADVDRVAVAVTEEAPFKITIVEPKAPLVQNGSMNLRIVAERKPDFKAPITIYPLFNPPGVGSAPSATIPEGQNETVLPMNANGGAQVRVWKTAVLASATVGNGPVWVSSQLASIEIAPPFVTFAMERNACEQGQQTEIFCKLTHAKPFEGKATVKLIGLPHKVTTPDLEITKDTKELTFKVTVDKESPAGTHKNLFCQVLLPINGETVVHNQGSTELRIDKPLPPKPNAPPPPPTAKPEPPKPAQPMEKRLTRLEKLRLEQQEREKAEREKAGQNPPPKP